MRGAGEDEMQKRRRAVHQKRGARVPNTGLPAPAAAWPSLLPAFFCGRREGH